MYSMWALAPSAVSSWYCSERYFPHLHLQLHLLNFHKEMSVTPLPNHPYKQDGVLNAIPTSTDSETLNEKNTE